MFSEIFNDKYYKLMVLLAMEDLALEDINEAKRLLKEIDIERLYKVCCEHEFESIIYPRLIELYEEKLPHYWYESYLRIKHRTKFMINKLKEIADKLNEVGIPIIALKNSGICAAFIEDYARCPMGDIDTLVNKDSFIKAHKILTDMNLEFKFRSEYEFEDLHQAYIDGGAEYYFKDDANGNEMWFEMSWRPIAGRWIRIDREPNTEALIGNSETVKDTRIRILSPEDNLLQVAIHTAKHSYVRQPGFRLHLDVDRVVRYQQIDWEVFYKKVEAVGTKTAVYFSLLIAKHIFKTPIPDKILQRLRPKKHKEKTIIRALKKAKLLHPDTKKFSRFGFVKFQIMIYDQMLDIFKVVMPSIKWFKENTISNQ